ncbi:MAG: lipoprotein insertase outer membrane protein LolB [Burkholderiales bacterium]
MRADARIARYCTGLALCALLAACSTSPYGSPDAFPSFTLQGRVLVKGGGTAFSSGLRWQAAPAEDELWLNAPLGQTLGHLRRDAAGAMLTTADQTVYRAGSIDSLTRRAFGWELPVDGLRWWVLGRAAPTPAPTQAARDAQQRLILLVQDGWRVQFEYDGDATRPLRLQVAKADAEIRLAIDVLDLAGAP